MALPPARDVATLGMALGGVTTLLTGVALLMTLAASTPRLLVAAFLLSVGLTAVSAATVVFSGMRGTRPSPPESFGEPSPNGHRD
ncbi:MAG: hypothetical protein M3N51_08550 [Actinomycetota bacterium]|nr:hypothetical protein [Actinomycetota bacterium]